MLRVGRPKNSRFQLITLAAVAFLTTTAFLATSGQRTLADANEAAVNSPNAVAQKSISSGSYNSCVVLTTSAVKCWGYNLTGQVGDGTLTNQLSPTDPIGLSSGAIAVEGGASQMCVLLTTGAVKCWGQNSYGLVGDGTTTNRNTPTDVIGLSSGVSAIAGGQFHNCVLLSVGGVKCWGYNGYGQLGDGTTVDKNTTTDVSGLSSGVTAIAAGTYHTCALLTTGAVKCWGYNNYSQVGDGTAINRNTPTDVPGLSSGVTAIAAGGYHTCALLTIGAVKCWGYNNFGQLGDGTTSNRTAPTDVSGLSSGATAISLGTSFTCALLSSGAAKCWGQNTYGAIGDGTTTSRSTPTDVSGLSNAVAITTAAASTCAVISTGAVKCWGRNSFGSVGDGTTTDRYTPADVIGLPTGVAIVGTTTTTTVSSSSTTVAIAGASTTTSVATTTTFTTAAVKASGTTKAPEIPITGNNSSPLAMLGVMALFAGLVVICRRRIV